MSIQHQQYLNIKTSETQNHHEIVIKYTHPVLAGQQMAAGVLEASDLYYFNRNIAFTFNSRTSNSQETRYNEHEYSFPSFLLSFSSPTNFLSIHPPLFFAPLALLLSFLHVYSFALTTANLRFSLFVPRLEKSRQGQLWFTPSFKHPPCSSTPS